MATEKRYHSITFTIPEAAEAFAHKAMMGVRSMVHIEAVNGLTVQMSSDCQLAPAQIRLIKGEAAANFGMLSASKFNLTREALLKQQIQGLMQKPIAESTDSDVSDLNEARYELEELGWLVEHPSEDQVRFKRINVASRTEAVRLGHVPE